MLYVKPDKEWIDHILADELLDKRGALLLAKGRTLTIEDISNLIERKISYISIEGIIKRLDKEIIKMYQDTISYLEQVFNAAENYQKIDQEKLYMVINRLVARIIQAPGLFLQIHSLKNNHNCLYQHSVNVGIYSAVLAKLQGYSVDQIKIFAYAGCLHDIGKTLIPKSINNRRVLSKDEDKSLKEHPRLGYHILLNNGIEDSSILAAALFHHERLNRAGYPMGKKASKIPITAQIVAIANYYDTINKSPYHDYSELREQAFDKILNPELALKFINYFTEIMVGKKVLLNDGSVGMVLSAFTTEPNRPLVKRNGKFLDLRNERNYYIKELIG